MNSASIGEGGAVMGSDRLHLESSIAIVCVLATETGAAPITQRRLATTSIG